MMFFNVSEGGGNLSQGDESGLGAEDTSERICSALVLYMRLLDEIFE